MPSLRCDPYESGIWSQLARPDNISRVREAKHEVSGLRKENDVMVGNVAESESIRRHYSFCAEVLSVISEISCPNVLGIFDLHVNLSSLLGM